MKSQKTTHFGSAQCPQHDSVIELVEMPKCRNVSAALILYSMLLTPLLFLGEGLGVRCSAQNVGISSTGATPDNSAMLDVTSNTKGMLIPRMTSAEKYAIPSPATGLLIFQTDTVGFWYYDGTKWIPLVSSTSSTASPSNAGWLTTGNIGTAWDKNFLGTTDNVSLRLRTNNVERMIVDSVGKVGIGTVAPNANFDVIANQNVYNGASMRVYNTNSGNQASSVIYTQTDAGQFFMAQGSSACNSGYSVLESNTSGPLQIRKTNNSGDITFTTTTSYTERMRITNGGSVGIGTASPSQKLQVTGGNILLDNNQYYCGKTSSGGVKALLSLGDAHAVNDYTKILSGGAGITFLNASGAAELLTIDNGGNVGIGTTSPGARLQVSYGTSHELLNINQTTPASFNVDLTWQSNGTSRWITSVRTAANSDFWFFNNGRSLTDLTILNSNGNVGIGTTSPSAKLDISSSTGYNQLRMRTSYTPSGSADSNGNTGDMAWDSNYIYIKTAAGWKRAALSTW